MSLAPHTSDLTLFSYISLHFISLYLLLYYLYIYTETSWCVLLYEGLSWTRRGHTLMYNLEISYFFLLRHTQLNADFRTCHLRSYHVLSWPCNARLLNGMHVLYLWYKLFPKRVIFFFFSPTSTQRSSIRSSLALPSASIFHFVLQNRGEGTVSPHTLATHFSCLSYTLGCQQGLVPLRTFGKSWRWRQKRFRMISFFSHPRCSLYPHRLQ